MLLLITYHFLHCEPLHSLTAVIGAVFGIGFIFAAIFVVLLCLYYHKVWKQKHQHAPVSERVMFDEHGSGDESYVNIDLHNVSHLSMIVCNFMCIVQKSLEIPVTLYNAFFFNCRTYSQLVLYCNVCLQDSAATLSQYQCPQLLAKTGLVADGNMMSKQQSSPSR